MQSNNLLSNLLQQRPNMNRTETDIEFLDKQLAIDGPILQDDLNDLPSQQKLKELLQASKTMIKQEQQTISPLARLPLSKLQSQKQDKIVTSLVANTKNSSAPAHFSHSSGNNMEEALHDLQHKYESLASENMRLKELLRLRQETYQRREKRMTQEIQDLKMQLQSAVTTELHDEKQQEQFKQLRSMKAQIEEKINHLQGENNKALEERESEMNKRIDELLKKFKKELSKERKKNFNGEKEWLERSKALKKKLETATEEAIGLDSKNNELMKENQKLKIQFHAQEEDRDVLLKQVARLKRENHQYKEQLKQAGVVNNNTITASQETPQRAMSKSVEFSKRASTAPNNLQQRLPLDLNMSHQQQNSTDQQVANLKRIVEHERKQLKTMRNAHLTLLAERTELEIFVKQCIEDVKHDIGKTNNAKKQSGEFTTVDRQRVVDLLLSKERVLALLYDKMFPVKRATSPLQVVNHQQQSQHVLLPQANAAPIKSKTYDELFSQQQQSITKPIITHSHHQHTVYTQEEEEDYNEETSDTEEYQHNR